jgi:hypothetical protein
VVYGITGSLLYRQRAISNAALWDSDILVFYLPAFFTTLIVGCVVKYSLPSEWRARDKWFVALGTAAVVTFVAMATYMTVVFNAYGT